MDPRIPNKKERDKLIEIYRTQGMIERITSYILIPGLLLMLAANLLIQHTTWFKSNPILLLAIAIITIIMFIAAIYFGIKRELMKRCPRCSMWGVPQVGVYPARGNCPKCGMYLDLSAHGSQNSVNH